MLVDALGAEIMAVVTFVAGIIIGSCTNWLRIK